MACTPDECSTSDMLQVEPWLQKVSRSPEAASRNSMRYPTRLTSSLAKAVKVIGLPGATIDGSLTMSPTPSQRTATWLEVSMIPVVGTSWVGATTYATKSCTPVLPV